MTHRNWFTARRMKRVPGWLAVVVSVGAAAGLGFLAGCTSSGPGPDAPPTGGASLSPDPTPAEPDSTSVTLDSLTPDDSAWVRSLPAPAEARILTAQQAETGLSLPWKFLGVGAGDNVIQVAYVAGDGTCVLPEGFYVVQRDGGAIVAAVSRSTGNKACSDKAIVNRVWLHLPIRVGGQAVLEHAPVSPDWSSSGYFD